MSMSAGIDALRSQSADDYSATAPVVGGAVDATASTVTGNRDTNLFKDNNELGKQDFLRLLTVQLQYQDPLNPMDNTELVAQLAQFSALEGTNNIESAITDLGDSFSDSLAAQSFTAQSITNSSAVSLIGKQVRLRESAAYFDGATGTEVPIRVHLGSRTSATVQILDKDGEVVRTLETEGKDAENSAVATWDGTDNTGQQARPGWYELNVVGRENDLSLYCFVQDMVQGVRFAAEGPMVKVGGKELSVADIMDVSVGSKSSAYEGDTLTPSTAVSLLGKSVRVRQDEISYLPVPGATIDIRIDLSGVARDEDGQRRARIEVVDETGAVVRARTVAAGADGTVLLSMETTDYSGSSSYTVRIVDTPMTRSAYFFGEGTVDGISTVDGVTRIRMNGKTISLSDIVDISSAA